MQSVTTVTFKKNTQTIPKIRAKITKFQPKLTKITKLTDLTKIIWKFNKIKPKSNQNQYVIFKNQTIPNFVLGSFSSRTNKKHWLTEPNNQS